MKASVEFDGIDATLTLVAETDGEKAILAACCDGKSHASIRTSTGGFNPAPYYRGFDGGRVDLLSSMRLLFYRPPTVDEALDGKKTHD